MKKSLLASAIALAALPALSNLAGAAGPVAYSRTEVVACFANAAMPQIGLTVTNPGNAVVVPKGAKIKISIWTRNPDKFATYTVIADKDLQMASGNRLMVKRPAGVVLRCAATATFPRYATKILTRQ